MHACTAKVLLVYILSGNALYDRRTGKEHIRSILDHEGEVCQGRGINGTAGARAEDTGNLRNHSGCQDITLEDFSEACQ